MKFRWKEGDRIIGLPGTSVMGERATIHRVYDDPSGYSGYYIIFDKNAPLVESWYIYDAENIFTDELPKHARLYINMNKLQNEALAMNSPSVSKECMHVWKNYQGFTDNYDYCEKCDLKK